MSIFESAKGYAANAAAYATKLAPIPAFRFWFFNDPPTEATNAAEHKLGVITYKNHPQPPTLHEAWMQERTTPTANGRGTPWITPARRGPWVDGPRRNPWDTDEPRRNRWEQ